MRFGSEYNPRRDESTTLTLAFTVHDRTASILAGLANSRYAPVILALEPTLCYASTIRACLLSSCLRRMQAGHDASDGHFSYAGASSWDTDHASGSQTTALKADT